MNEYTTAATSSTDQTPTADEMLAALREAEAKIAKLGPVPVGFEMNWSTLCNLKRNLSPADLAELKFGHLAGVPVEIDNDLPHGVVNVQYKAPPFHPDQNGNARADFDVVRIKHDRVAFACCGGVGEHLDGCNFNAT